MTEPEVLLPALSDEENNVVEHFLEASKELLPSVQVTLAKRIMRPGSSKVLCMAARTSVPLNDDEQASVSDLALRLSDGTNVKLTLSFFNEGDGDIIAPPLKRLNYVPEHYESVQNDPNLGQVIFATCLIAVTSFYYMAKSPAGLQAGLLSAPPAAAHAHHSTVQAVLPVAPKASVSAKAQSRAVTPATPAPKSVGKAKHAVFFQNNGQHEKAPKSVHSHNDAFFVPPPPPISYSYPVQPMPFMPQMMGAPTYMQAPVSQVRSAPSKVEHAKAAATAPQTAVKPAPEETKFEETRSVQKVAPDLLPSPAPSLPEKYAGRKPTPQTSIHKSIDAEAPSPGLDNGYPQLERIVPPVRN